MSERYLQIDKVRMIFETRKGPFCALEEISLDIYAGEFVSLIGHSGCGKSTLLNIVTGLLEPSDGHVFLANREITGPGPDRGVVFQNHSLLPWLTCFENVQLGHAEHKYPHELSGGMKQRVGIARALSIEPKVLLLDEPFGALDALTRAHLQDELMRIVTATGSTVLMVTHDVDEAVLLSDRVVMMTNGPAATIGGILAIDLPRPRDRIALAGNKQYVALRAELLEFLYRKQMREAA